MPPPGEGWGFREFAQRRGDFALAGAATRIALAADGTIDRPIIVVFGTFDRPARATAAEALLVGERPSDESFVEAARLAADIASADDPRPDAVYRRRLLASLVESALRDAMRKEAAR